MFLALTCISKCQWKLAIRILLEGKIVFKWAAHRIHLVGEVVKDKLFKQYRVSISKEVKQVDCFLKKKLLYLSIVKTIYIILKIFKITKKQRGVDNQHS